MSVTREEALELLHDWTKTESLRNHALAVEIAMHEAARVYGGEDADPERWAITGLLHDADYERWPEEHPKRVVDWLRERDEEEMARHPYGQDKFLRLFEEGWERRER